MVRRRGLSEEEARLWAGVARQAIPLRGKRLPDLPAELSASPAAVLRVAMKPLMQGPRPATGPQEPPSSMPSYQAGPQAKGPAAPAALALHPIEKPVRRKIGKGRVPIEGTIDLHDKTQGLAHDALLGFLRQAQASGLRHVLVITGRGASFGSRGVIKRSLPHWFATGAFRLLVAGFEPAERGHGGDGAFYVRVRRR